MGFVKVRSEISNPIRRGRSEELELIADTGAIYTVIPRNTLDRIGVKPIGKRKFRLADGTVKEFKFAEAHILINGIGVTSLVVFGRKKAPALLGVTTLELLGLEVDPITGKLKSMDLYLL